MPFLKMPPRPIGPQPTLPTLIQKLDRLEQLKQELLALKAEIEQDLIEASRADTRRYEIIMASRVNAALAANPKAKTPGSAIRSEVKKERRKAKWMEALGL